MSWKFGLLALKAWKLLTSLASLSSETKPAKTDKNSPTYQGSSLEQNVKFESRVLISRSFLISHLSLFSQHVESKFWQTLLLFF